MKTVVSILIACLLMVTSACSNEVSSTKEVIHNVKENKKKKTEVTVKPTPIKENILLNAPIIHQMPELPRGCEVTSLAMLLQFAGVDVDKMTLAKEIKKDITTYQVKDGVTYFGNPHDGFVGDMYTFQNPGLGVYHEPIKELAEKYLPGKVIDFSGSDFNQVISYLSEGKPVWVINNVLFDTVPSQNWKTWKTPSGEISITYKEHSVLLTGYDRENIYFNDPLTGEKNRKVPLESFKRGWEQMGKQAISLL